MARLNRHALYYRLIDASFLSYGALIAGALSKAITGVSAFHGLLYYPFMTIFTFALVVTPLLIFQRWMRDDFSEVLWQRSAGTVLKGLIILPLPIMIAVAVAFVTGHSSFTLKNSISGLERESAAALLGFGQTMVYLWMLTPVLFVFAFQWHRWRASR